MRRHLERRHYSTNIHRVNWISSPFTAAVYFLDFCGLIERHCCRSEMSPLVSTFQIHCLLVLICLLATSVPYFFESFYSRRATLVPIYVLAKSKCKNSFLTHPSFSKVLGGVLSSFFSVRQQYRGMKKATFRRL